MARRTVSRLAKRAEAEAAAKKEATKKKESGKKLKTVATKKKAAKKKKSRSTAAKEVRLKAYWGVFNQSMQQVELFEYAERKKADKCAKDLTKKKGTPHFVQLVKTVLEE
ncbi:MAG: hypothetical protein D6741_13675 [Planctomycetota bacterium]|nr:MAG: hypothetical protein D6741_13675 [Planctomycetota bacterium]